MDSLFIKGEKFISSKRAAELSGYTQDYIGQLSRKGKISGERVSGAWYINENELLLLSKKNSKKEHENEKTDQLPQTFNNDITNETNTKNRDADNHTITVDGVTYLSSRQVAETLGYTQDYVGQLCRSGAMEARQFGRGWYIPQSLVAKYREERSKKKDEDTGVVDSQKESLENILIFNKEKKSQTPPTLAETKKHIEDTLSKKGEKKPVSREVGKEKEYHYPSFLNATYSFDDTALIPTPMPLGKPLRKSLPLYNEVVSNKAVIQDTQSQPIHRKEIRQYWKSSKTTKDRIQSRSLVQRSPLSLMHIASVGVVMVLFASLITFIPNVLVFNPNTQTLKAQIATSGAQTSLIESIITVIGGIFKAEIEYKAK